LENKQIYHEKIEQEEKMTQNRLVLLFSNQNKIIFKKMMKKMESDEEMMKSNLYRTLLEERSIEEELNQINSQNFKSNQFLICKYNKTTVTPNLKHRKFAKTQYYI